MHKILCPIDFSAGSLNALEFAVKLGEVQQSFITLMYVFTEDEFDQVLESDSIATVYANKVAIAEGKLADLAMKINEISLPKGLKGCNFTLQFGKRVTNILEYANEERIDLIVMGMVGITGPTEQYIGGRTQKVIQYAACNVLCIPEELSFQKIKKIIYATDYQEEDKIAIQQVIAMASLLKAYIEVVHISRQDQNIDKAIYIDFVEEMKSFVPYKKLVFNREVYKDVKQGIHKYMHDKGADLLVLLSKRRNYFLSLFSSSLTKDLTFFADYPLLIIKL
jgi:nucleotide-binding universal stress UspA family protein